MLTVKRNENATSVRFSRTVSLVNEKWPRNISIRQPKDAEAVWRLVRSHGKLNWKPPDQHTGRPWKIFNHKCSLTCPSTALLKRVRVRFNPKYRLRYKYFVLEGMLYSWAVLSLCLSQRGWVSGSWNFRSSENFSVGEVFSLVSLLQLELARSSSESLVAGIFAFQADFAKMRLRRSM